jgi:WXG100 family type VII secretion target
MNSDDILIRQKPMMDARDAMRAHVKRIHDIIDDFRKDMDGVAQKWTGGAPAAWAMRQESINSEIGDMNRVLNQVGNQVVETADAFHAMDKKWEQKFMVG